MAILGTAAAFQVAVTAAALLFEPNLAFATDPCGEDVLFITCFVSTAPAVVCAAIVFILSSILHRARIRKCGFGFAVTYVLAVLALLLGTIGPRYGSDWAAVRAAWALSIDDDEIRSWRRWGPAMPVWIGERRATMRLLEKDYVRLDLGGGANMDVYLPAMVCTYSD